MRYLLSILIGGSFATSAHPDPHDAPNVCIHITTLLPQTIKRARVLRDIVVSYRDSFPDLVTKVEMLLYALEAEHDFIQSGEVGSGADCDIGFMNRAIRGIAATCTELSSFCVTKIGTHVGSHPKVPIIVKNTTDSFAKDWAAALPSSDPLSDGPITSFVEFRMLSDVIQRFQTEARGTRAALLSLTRGSSTMPHLSPLVRPVILDLLTVTNEVGVVEASLSGLEMAVRDGSFDFEFMLYVSQAVSQHAITLRMAFEPLIKLSPELPARQQAMLAALVTRLEKWVLIGGFSYQLSTIIRVHYVEQEPVVTVTRSPGTSRVAKVRNRDLKRRSGTITSVTSTTTATAPSSAEGEIERVDGAAGIDGCDGDDDTVDRTDTLLLAESVFAADSGLFNITNCHIESQIPRKDRRQSTPEPRI